jgi:hypothetical protein
MSRDQGTGLPIKAASTSRPPGLCKALGFGARREVRTTQARPANDTFGLIAACGTRVPPIKLYVVTRNKKGGW